MSRSLEGKLALVTGGARGIGRETCIALAEWGADFIAADIDEAGALATAREGMDRGVNAEGIRLDVSDLQEIKSKVAMLARKYGNIDILVNSAGIGPTTPLFEVDEEHWHRVIGINLKGTFFISQVILKLMIEAEIPGRIVNLASLAGEIGSKATSPDYGISKGGIETLTKGFARFAGHHGINVNAVSPGIIITDMIKDWSEEMNRKRLAEIPLQRFGDPKEVATVIRFLVSEDASYINGQIIRVNGGQYI